MPFPRQSKIELPLLEALISLGGEAKPRELYSLVANSFPDLTQEEQNQTMESAPSTRKWWNMVQWARQKLVEKGEIDGSVHGLWKITDLGKARVNSPETYREPVAGGLVRRSVPEEPSNPSPFEMELAAEINLRDLVTENLDQVKGRLVSELIALTPTGFEKFCSVLLSQLGYEDLSVTRRGADDGIDGFGSFRQGVVRIKSAFQAKRWKDTVVGRPEIDKFRGAIQGEYDHGVFLTTSRFSKDALDSSIKRGAITILLLDGNGIADLMLEKGVGVTKQPVYLADVDREFFDFDES